MLQTALPVDEWVGRIVDRVRAERFAVVVAPPGSGKTTRIPPALTALGRTILLQPRRVAARALARRIASERGWSVGDEVGWQIRFERRFSDRTQLLVATEGILTARILADPLLSDFNVVVLDEFHERSIHADLALALVKEAALSRDDLAVVVMSATIDAERVARYLGEGAAVFEIGAPRFPVETQYRPDSTVADAVREVLATARGDVLAFLPGVREIERARAELSGIDALVLPLHGTLDVDAQERALAPAPRRKVILATNVAETSLTVEGVTDVVDSGLRRVLRYDPASGIDHLVTERIPSDSADQRAGRAGRTSPGRATRLWHTHDILRPHGDAEVQRVDLASTLLDVIAWGADPKTFDWFEPPSLDRIEAALGLLSLLGAIEVSDARPRITMLGNAIRRLPLHPRLARLVLDSGCDRTAIAIAAAISEGTRLTRSETTDSDAFALADAAPVHVVRELERACSGLEIKPRGADVLVRSRAPARLTPRERTRRPLPSSEASTESKLLHAIFTAYPDRVAMRRSPRSERLLLAAGTGAVLARESGVLEGDFLVALEIGGSGSGEPLVRAASRIEREWLAPTRRETLHTIEGGRVRAIERAWYGAILLHEQSVAPDASEAAALLAADRRTRIDPLLLRRLAFAGIDVDWDALLAGARSADFASLLPYEVRSKLDRLAPVSIQLPSGRGARLDYREDGSVFAAVKLQELFGLAETPRIGAHQLPVTFELLAPNGRPVQVTRDLRSFWNTTYAEVRKELRARYPMHPWPDDPWSATPTHRTRRR